MGYSPRSRKEWDMTERLHFHFHFNLTHGFPGGSLVKNQPANARDAEKATSIQGGTLQVELLQGLEDPLEKEMATPSNILAWETPWTEEPGGLQSMGSQESDMT